LEVGGFETANIERTLKRRPQDLVMSIYKSICRGGINGLAA
jgi:hypothetical protein